MEGSKQKFFTVAMAAGVMLHFAATYIYSLHKIEELWPAYLCGVLGALALMIAGAVLAQSKGRSMFMGVMFGVFSVVGLIVLSMMPSSAAASGMREEDLSAPAADYVLMKAAHDGDLAALEARLEAGVPLDGRERSGQSALHVALADGHGKAALFLLSKGADAQARDKLGNTPLHLAGELGSWGVCEALLDAGAEVDAVGNDGWTALHCAAAWNAKGVVEGLVARGASLSAKNAKGMTPKEQAEFENHQEVGDLLRHLEQNEKDAP
ncbi:MAG: ankyrin repeat domain-containing protein [Deltaproteobacteria bacterium]|nr:ankyrin repeat domain-containing protein [Deltaproteobacteria bacterium]